MKEIAMSTVVVHMKRIYIKIDHLNILHEIVECDDAICRSLK